MGTVKFVGLVNVPPNLIYQFMKSSRLWVCAGCPTCSIWSYFIQDKLVRNLYSVLVLGQVFSFIFDNYNELVCYVNKSSVDPDQLAPSEAS